MPEVPTARLSPDTVYRLGPPLMHPTYLKIIDLLVVKLPLDKLPWWSGPDPASWKSLK